jgi:DNA-binding response OmpR family regulator
LTNRRYPPGRFLDDDEPLGRMLCKSITAKHKNVLAFGRYDPHEALSLAGKLYLDVLICDIHMPGLFGDKIIQSMKKAA